NEETPVDSRANHNLAILSKIFKNFQKYVHYRKITSEDGFSVVKYFFTGYLDILKESRVDEIFSEEDYPNECIPFLTIHQSKGLEFPVVIVFSLNSKPNRYEDDDISRQTSIDRLINSSSKLSENDKEKFDFYRKFYVAFSRAKNLLVLSSYEMGVSENFKPFFYSIRGVNSLQFDINEVNLDEVTKKDERKILSYTTDIAPYRHCPMKYYLVREKEYSTFSKKIFNLGIITHKAIEHINKLFLQKKNPFLDNEYIENLLKNIYRFQNIDLDNNFERIMSIVKKYIEDEKDNFEYIKKVEASEFRIENDYILYGQIDLILEDENEIQIIDFKTGKYNEFEYSSNYRQQLSLYKLLLQKKYDKDIKTYLYYLEEDEPKKEILITDEELEEDFKNINKTTQDILDNKFPKIPYNHNICGICEFKNYCWGLE
ncbi:MAG: PD-(D/E)XK nuclease family protein, partial [Fusobacterium periodonticum]|nr:PD-(D/E)XK nuclease family protein [Fusobacterium periodonticum]